MAVWEIRKYKEESGKSPRSVFSRIYHQALYLLNLQYLVFRQTSYFLDCPSSIPFAHILSNSYFFFCFFPSAFFHSFCISRRVLSNYRIPKLVVELAL